jgi:hypothetical protein
MYLPSRSDVAKKGNTKKQNSVRGGRYSNQVTTPFKKPYSPITNRFYFENSASLGNLVKVISIPPKKSAEMDFSAREGIRAMQENAAILLVDSFEEDKDL